MQLAAIAYANTDPGARRDEPEYHLLAVFDDGAQFPISPQRYAAEIEAMQVRAWPSFGCWINDQPATVWAASLQSAAAAWGQRITVAPCRVIQGENTFHTRIQIGDSNWWLVPTRSQARIAALRRKYPLWQGDLIFAPADELERANARARQPKSAERS